MLVDRSENMEYLRQQKDKLFCVQFRRMLDERVYERTHGKRVVKRRRSHHHGPHDHAAIAKIRNEELANSETQHPMQPATSKK